MGFSRPRRGRMQKIMTIGAARRSGVAVLDLSSSTGSTIDKTARKKAKAFSSSALTSSSGGLLSDGITSTGNPETWNGREPTSCPHNDFSTSRQRKKEKRLRAIFLRRGRARSNTANDSSPSPSCSCSRCTDHRFKSRNSHTTDGTKDQNRILDVSRRSASAAAAAVPNANATATGNMFSQNSSADFAETSASTSTNSTMDATSNAAQPQGAPGAVDDDEYRSAAAFLTAFHSRTVAVVRATELGAINEDSDVSVDENQMGECHCADEESGDQIPSLCMRKDGSLTRRSKTSCSLSSLAADDAVPDLTEEEDQAQNDFSWKGHPGTHPTTPRISQDASYDAEAWGLFLDSEADRELQTSFALPSSVQHYGMVGGMRASASLHHSRGAACIQRSRFDRQMTI